MWEREKEKQTNKQKERQRQAVIVGLLEKRPIPLICILLDDFRALNYCVLVVTIS